MRVLVLGSDGYLGFPLSVALQTHGHTVVGVDSGLRRELVAEVGSCSLTPQPSIRANLKLDLSYADLNQHLDLAAFDAIVHLAEQPSAPYSMRSCRSAGFTYGNNLCTTLNLLWSLHESGSKAHLVKLGTMGEYGTPNCVIPEGWFEHDGARMLFPRSPGSFYHLTKVHDTDMINFASRVWGLTCTDIMQGVVYGVSISELEGEQTRYDYDECFGTVINRFCAQAHIGHPLTVYGLGEQRRGFLPLQDSINCLRLLIENPPKRGEHRIVNQFEHVYSVKQLAYLVHRAYALHSGRFPAIDHVANPRIESEQHFYAPEHTTLKGLGYQPSTTIERGIARLLEAIEPYATSIDPTVIDPHTKWSKRS